VKSDAPSAKAIILTNRNSEVPSPRVSAGDSDDLGPGSSTADLTPEGVTMKTILLMTAVLVLASCEKRDGTPAADTSAMAPATSDTGMMHSDTAMARDTAKK
jgi:hypothetical protein